MPHISPIIWYHPPVNQGAGGLGLNPGLGSGGQMSVGQTIALSAPTIAAGVITQFAASGALWATAAIPFVGPIVAGVTLGLTALFARKGPKQKVATTQIVDQVEPLLADNVNGYLTGPRTVTAREQAIANFYAGWNFVVEHCNIPEMGEPGQRCTSERQRGGKWDWFRLYLDPIEKDTPNPDPVLTPEIEKAVDNFNRTLEAGLGLGVGSGKGWLVMGAGLLVLGLVVGGGFGGFGGSGRG